MDPQPPGDAASTSPSPRQGVCAVLKLTKEQAHAEDGLAQLIVSSPPILDASSCEMDASESAILVDQVLAVPAIISLNMCGNTVDEATRAMLGQRLLSEEEVPICGLQSYISDDWALRPGQCWLDLREVAAGEADFLLLGGLLRRNTTIQGLDVSGSPLVKDEDITGIEAVTRGLSLASNASQLTSLSLCSTNLGDRGAAILAQALETRPQLRSLAIANNGFGPSGTAAIAKVIGKLTSLTSFDISHNRNIGVWGQGPLLNLLIAVVVAGARDKKDDDLKGSCELGLVSLRIADVGLVLPEFYAEGSSQAPGMAGSPEETQLWHKQLRRLQRFLGPRTAPSIEAYELKQFETRVYNSHARMAKAIMVKGGKEMKDSWRGGAGLKGVKLDFAAQREKRRLKRIHAMRYGHADNAAALAMAFEHEKYRFGSKRPGGSSEKQEEEEDEGGVSSSSLEALSWRERMRVLQLDQPQHSHWSGGDNGQLLLVRELLDTGRLQVVDLSDNYIGITGARALADALLGVGARSHSENAPSMPLHLTLHTLLLARCGLCGIHERYRCSGPSTYDAAGLKMLMHALCGSSANASSRATTHSSSRLHSIDLSDNFIGFRRTEAMLDALVLLLKQNATLGHMNLSSNFLGGPGRHKVVLGRSRTQDDRRRRECQHLAVDRLSHGFQMRAGGTPLVVNLNDNGIDAGGIGNLRRHMPKSVTITAERVLQCGGVAAAAASLTPTAPPPLPNALTPTATPPLTTRKSSLAFERRSQQKHQALTKDAKPQTKSYYKCVQVGNDFSFSALANPHKKYTVGNTQGSGDSRSRDKTKGQLLTTDPSRLDGRMPAVASTSPMGSDLEVNDCVFTNAIEALCSADTVKMHPKSSNARLPVVVVRCRCWGKCKRGSDGSLCFANTRLVEVLPNRCTLCEQTLPVHTHGGQPYAGVGQHTEADRCKGICTGIYPVFDL
jgi:hypothetical protein